MKVFNRSRSVMGAYFGSYSKHPKGQKNAVVTFKQKNVEVAWGGFHVADQISWDDVISFDFERISDGVFKITIKLTDGDIVLESSSLHVGEQGDQAMWADSRREKLNKTKIFVQNRKHELALAESVLV